jgi:hypothetical protein
VGENWITKEGKDGRLVAYPFGVGENWITKEGADGRVIPIPGNSPAAILLTDAATVARANSPDSKGMANDLLVYFWVNQD